ncbi:hypothetical protein BDP27DRAFT_1460234 [Rhodocollybia butyracea]|uniref:Uncharacterized protein n=1 Tax=Rhodocollybia butyracea TaxID=206335 RepID=A0A9P5UFU0_9AGAR|nr:hypothetical protein BDP27DRAFT_1460234 [Rhodocollybia butyracea]
MDDANLLKDSVLSSIECAARSAKSSDHIVILIFSRGDSDKEHLGRVECGAEGTETLWLTREEVEGKQKLIKHWALFAASAREQESQDFALPAPGSHAMNQQLNSMAILNNYDWQSGFEEENDDSTIIVDFSQLDAMIDHWMTSTRPGFLTTSARQSLLRNIQQYRKGRTSSPRNRTLFRFFKARAAADHLAQELADAASMLQWLLISWAQSGKDAEVLHKIIRDANPWSSDRDIHYNHFSASK